MTDSYVDEPPFKGNMKMLPAGGKDNARKDEGLTERVYDNPPVPPLKVEVKSHSVPTPPEKKLISVSFLSSLGSAWKKTSEIYAN